MRIALFHDLPSGGAKRTLHELTRRLAPRHDIDAYTLGTADEGFCDLRPLVRSHRQFTYAPSPELPSPLGRLNPLQRWRDLGRLVAISRQIAACIDAGGYDVVLAEPSMWTQAPLVLPWLATPALYRLHEPPRALYEPDLNRSRARAGWRRALDRVDPLPDLYRSRARRLDREATRAATRVVANSRFTAEQVRRIYGIEPGIVYHGVDGERFRPGSEPRRREVLSVGALQPSEGFDFVVAALALLDAAMRPGLRIVANAALPVEHAYLVELAARHGVHLEIEIGIDDALLARRYAQAALLAYAPHREPFGLAPLEAMACATPVVGVAEGGLLESIRDGVTGLLVAREPHEFATAVRRLLADEALRRRLGGNGRDDVRTRWTWEIAAQRLEGELAGVARGAASRAGAA